MICYLGLGSNLGNREANLNNSLSKLKILSDTTVLEVSKMIETEPVGFLEQPLFINCVVKIETGLSPEILLKEILNIENDLGRKRVLRWGPRIIDIDILFYGNKIIDSDDLTVPHKELHKRKFVLDSLLELCPNYLHPVKNITIKELHKAL